MSTHRRFNMRLRRSAGIAIVAAIAVTLIITGATLAAGGPPDQKQAILAKVRSDQATAAAGPRAPKPTAAPQGAQPASSCPQTVATGIGPFREAPFHADAIFTTEAGAASAAGDPYLIFAGALRGDPQQGVLFVLRSEKDPCAVAAGQVTPHSYLRSYPTPSRHGTLTLKQLVGETVAFGAADGSGGSFNFVIGQYLGG